MILYGMAEETGGDYVPGRVVKTASGGNAVTASSFNIVLEDLLSNGWTVMSDDPTGVLLKEPKKIRKLDVACLVLGVLTLALYGMGIIFILFAVLHYCFFTIPVMRFVSRH